MDNNWSPEIAHENVNKHAESIIKELEEVKRLELQEAEAHRNISEAYKPLIQVHLDRAARKKEELIGFVDSPHWYGKLFKRRTSIIEGATVDVRRAQGSQSVEVDNEDDFVKEAKKAGLSALYVSRIVTRKSNKHAILKHPSHLAKFTTARLKRSTPQWAIKPRGQRSWINIGEALPRDDDKDTPTTSEDANTNAD